MKKTALYQIHKNLNGRLVDFGGWSLPVQYLGIAKEHSACRNSCGIFDVSHMGEFTVEGKNAAVFLDYAMTNTVSNCEIGQAQYTVMCQEDGGIVDDLINYRLSEYRFLMVVNASNIEKDFKHLQQALLSFEKEYPNLEIPKLTNESALWSQIALQGPKAISILNKATGFNAEELLPFRIKETDILNTGSTWVARTGYTGEDGVEIYMKNQDAEKIWNSLFDAGKGHGLLPVGLGARDTLRLEMKYPLYGNELSEKTNPLEAGLAWVVKLKKKNFIGKSSLEQIKENGTERKLVGIQMLGPGVPRSGYELLNSEGKEKIGRLTSGTQSPSLGIPIGIGYIDKKYSDIGTLLAISVRNRQIPAKVVKTPFYHRNQIG